MFLFIPRLGSIRWDSVLWLISVPCQDLIPHLFPNTTLRLS